ncbi:uncharacterized protein KY384_006114 [Bacidia gigantensis]|uniref:uncharacterized protein n=1 Tax=Bacidia gigantensis TaxID=2732470 RepID=UPI001D03D5C7|nr:uncharacterized protein KY384_006114 [Bacidia gigantensis]KAG8529477.1 hypothetical protein KY384_006114 [Bacidia gigantensis]
MAPTPIYIPSSSLTPLPSQGSAKSLRSSQASTPPKSPAYREQNALPYELREHCLIYFEESLHTQALNLLLSVLSSGATPPSYLPAIIAPAHFLSLIATLSVHPTLTHRASTNDRAHAGNLALRYLRATLYSVGPIHGGLAEAFRFKSRSSAPARNGRVSRRRTQEVDVKDDDSEEINNDLANVASLWVRAEGFWHVVGWSFNCSILHHRRWEVWRDWLEYMIDVLETEWNLRVNKDDNLETSILAQYCGGDGKIAGLSKRILRAVFADGSGRAASEFGEVWSKETRELKKDGDERKVDKIDIDADNYGDYMDEEKDADLESAPSSSDEDSESQTKRVPKRKEIGVVNGSKHLGGMEALTLRLRLLSLLSNVSAQTPQSFMAMRNFYDLLLEHIRPLPLPTFFLIMSPSGLRYFNVSAASSLTQYILLTMMAANAPQPPNDHLDQALLERCYLPWAANSAAVVENTKVSLCVETLLRLLDREGALRGTDELMKAAEIGIEARREKSSSSSRSKGRKGRRSSELNSDQMWLEASAQRIRAVIDLAKRNAEQEISA